MQLETINNQDIITLEKRYGAILASLGLGSRLGRFREAFSVFNMAEELLKQSQKDIVTLPDSLVGRHRNAVRDLLDLFDICNAIDEHSVDDETLRKKLVILNKGSLDTTVESRVDTKARDTQFELRLWADFCSSGISASIEGAGQDGPDIIIEGENNVFAVECKRLFSASTSAFEQRAHKANQQLSTFHKSESGTIGIVAFDVTRLITEGNKYLRSELNEKQALEKLSASVSDIRKTYEYIWRKEIKNGQIAVVGLFASMYSYLAQRSLSTRAGFTQFHNTQGPMSSVHYKQAFNEVLSKYSVSQTGGVNIVREQAS